MGFTLTLCLQIYLVRQLFRTPQLIDDSKYLCEILNKLVMDHHNTDEPVALKLHYLSCIINQTAKAKAASNDGAEKAFLKRSVNCFYVQAEVYVVPPAITYL